MEINHRIGKVQLQSIESVVNGSHFTPFRLSWNALWSVGFSSECAVRLATDGLLVLSLSLLLLPVVHCSSYLLLSEAGLVWSAGNSIEPHIVACNRVLCKPSTVLQFFVLPKNSIAL